MSPNAKGRVAWHDNKLSCILSTISDPCMVDWMRRGKGNKYKEIKKPSANVLYSAVMDAVDVLLELERDLQRDYAEKSWQSSLRGKNLR